MFLILNEQKITDNIDPNKLIKIQLKYLNFDYKLINTYKEILDYLELNNNLTENTIVINKCCGINKFLIKDLDQINQLNQNTILGFDNKFDFILNNLTQNNRYFIPINNNLKHNNINTINCSSFLIKNLELYRILKSLEPEKLTEIVNYNYLSSKVNFVLISKSSYINKILIYNSRIFSSEYTVFKDFQKYSNLELLENNYTNYQNYLQNQNTSFNPSYLKNEILSSLHLSNLSYIFVFLNENVKISDLLNNLINQDNNANLLNTFYNNLIFIHNQDSKNLKNQLEYFKRNNPNFRMNTLFLDHKTIKISQIINSIPEFCDLYLITNSNELLNINTKWFNNYLDNDLLRLFKLPKSVYECYNFGQLFESIENIDNLSDNENDDNYQLKIQLYNNLKHNLSLITCQYFKDNYTIFNLTNNLDLKKNQFKLENLDLPNPSFNIDILDKYFDNQNYDLIYDVIKYVLINKLYTKPDLIYKSLGIIPSTNYQFKDEDVRAIINLVEIKDIQSLLSISTILIDNENISVIQEVLENYIKKQKIADTDTIILTYILYKCKLFKNNVNITYDKIYLDFFVKHISYIISNLEVIQTINSETDVNQIKIDLLTYLINRKELVSIQDFKIIQNYISTNITFNYFDLEKETRQNIIKYFEINPSLMINSILSLSECMKTTEDILLKRRNVSILSSVLNEYYSKDDSFIKKAIDEDLLDETTFLKLQSTFKYSYHGISNRELFKNLGICGQMCIKYCMIKKYSEKLNRSPYNSSNLQDFFDYQVHPTNKKKICFISNFLTRKHSVFKDRHQVIKHLANKGFDVYIATFNQIDYKFSQIFNGIKENIILKNTNFYSIIENVDLLRSYNFDKIVFCEIGMDGNALNLAYFRMARIQYNTWGHSDTSGFDNIDYFVSSKLYEEEYKLAQENYTEKLILQNSLCTSYVNPSENYVLDTPRTYYGLSKYDKIILCPQSLFKIMPEYDDYIFDILKDNPEASIVFVDSLDKKYQMYDRWDNKLTLEYQGILSRVKFIGSLDHKKFVNLIKLCDVMIDPYPFGGCNTSFEAFSVDIPVVTRPSTRINGRFTHGFYIKMGFTDLVANNKKEYVNLVTRLLNDTEFKNNTVEKIKNNKDKLFKDQETLQEWEELLSQ